MASIRVRVPAALLALTCILALAACGLPPTPTPLPSPTPLPPTPTPTPPPPSSALDILVASAEALKEQASYHLSMDMNMVVEVGGTQMAVPAKMEGDYLAPDRLRMRVTTQIAGADIEVETITIGSMTYVTDPMTGQWTVTEQDVAALSPEAIVALGPDQIAALEIVGEEMLDGVAVVHIRGTVSAEALALADSGMTGDVTEEVWVGVEDRLPRKLTLAGQLTLTGQQVGTVDMTATILMSDFGKPVTIEAPEVATP